MDEVKVAPVLLTAGCDAYAAWLSIFTASLVSNGHLVEQNMLHHAWGGWSLGGVHPKKYPCLLKKTPGYIKEKRSQVG